MRKKRHIDEAAFMFCLSNHTKLCLDSMHTRPHSLMEIFNFRLFSFALICGPLISTWLTSIMQECPTSYQNDHTGAFESVLLCLNNKAQMQPRHQIQIIIFYTRPNSLGSQFNITAHRLPLIKPYLSSSYAILLQSFNKLSKKRFISTKRQSFQSQTKLLSSYIVYHSFYFIMEKSNQINRSRLLIPYLILLKNYIPIHANWFEKLIY